MEFFFSSLEHSIEDKQLFFLHIPKTAGATLIQILEQQFDEVEIARWLYPFRLVNEPASFFAEHRYFHGHVEYDLMCSFLARPPVTLTMLRDPVERYLSQFGNHTRVSFSQIPDIGFDVFEQLQKTSLARFVYDPPEALVAEAKNWQNKQARMLAFELETDGNVPLKETDAFCRTRTCILPAPKFEQARDRLDQFSFFGITERFQDSLFLMAYTFGWPPMFEYETVNDSPSGGRPYQEQMPADLLEEIRNLNRTDLELYRHGQQLFETRHQQMCHELLERYGRREHAHLKLPLQQDVLIELLDTHYQQCFVERHSAVPAVRIEVDQKISGRNWQVLERDSSNVGFRWSGPGRCSTIDLPIAAASAVRLRFSVVFAITAEVLTSLAVKVNDQPIQIERRIAEDGATICKGYVSQAVLAGSPGCARLTFQVEKTVMPHEINPASQDKRRLGIALSWVEVEPVCREQCEEH